MLRLARDPCGKPDVPYGHSSDTARATICSLAIVALASSSAGLLAAVKVCQGRLPNSWAVWQTLSVASSAKSRCEPRRCLTRLSPPSPQGSASIADPPPVNFQGAARPSPLGAALGGVLSPCVRTHLCSHVGRCPVPYAKCCLFANHMGRQRGLECEQLPETSHDWTHQALLSCGTQGSCLSWVEGTWLCDRRACMKRSDRWAQLCSPTPSPGVASSARHPRAVGEARRSLVSTALEAR